MARTTMTAPNPSRTCIISDRRLQPPPVPPKGDKPHPKLGRNTKFVPPVLRAGRWRMEKLRDDDPFDRKPPRPLKLPPDRGAAMASAGTRSRAKTEAINNHRA